MKVISCSEAVSRMFEFFDGMISSKQKRELDEHINTCVDCCDRYEFEKLLKQKLSEINAQEKASEHLIKRVEGIMKSLK